MKKTMKNQMLTIWGLVILIAFFATNVQAQATTWKAPDSASTIKNPLSGNADAIKAGKKLFSQMCAICHGDKGKGDGMAGAALNPKPTNFTSAMVKAESDGVLFWKMTTGRAPMASYKEVLKEIQRWQLVSYIKTLQTK